MGKYLLSQLVSKFGGELVGEDVEISSVSSLENANVGDLSFFSNAKFKIAANHSKASALVVKKWESDFQHSQIIVKDPQLFVTRVLRLLNPAPVAAGGVHPSAVIAADAFVDPSAEISALVTIESGARIGAKSIIRAGVTIGRNVRIGSECLIHPRVVVYADCEIGSRVEIHSGAVIGADGFGNAWTGVGWVKIPQLGRVIIGSDVEIGANTTIDRGALDDTVISDGVRLDNLIQIAHNVTVGKNTAIAACTGVAGSANIGANCLIGGGVLIAGHIDIADGVTLLAGSAVPSSVNESGVYASGVPIVPHGTWLRNMVQFRRLDEMAKRLKKIEKKCYEDGSEP